MDNGQGDTHMADAQTVDERCQRALGGMEAIDGAIAYLSTLADKFRRVATASSEAASGGATSCPCNSRTEEDAIRQREPAPYGRMPVSDDHGLVQSLKRQIAELETNNAALVSDRDHWRAATNEARQDHADVFSLLQQKNDFLKQKDGLLEQNDHKIRSLHADVEAARQKEATLRAIITNNAGTQKVSDEEMTGRFNDLRQQIEAIARLPIHRMDLSAPSQTFCDDKIWSRLTPEERTNRVRAQIFESIYDNILECRLFGVEGVLFDEDKEIIIEATRKGNQNGKHLASGLRRFEQALECYQVPDHIISEWRTTTIGCVERLRLPGHLAAVVSSTLFELLDPLRTKSIQRRQEEDLRGRLLELCNKAVELRMMMRRSKGRFTCEFPGVAGLPMLLSKCEKVAEGVAVEGGRSIQASDDIAYTLFGGLVKQAEGGDGGKRVLEKALVILKKK
ncbi:hypothetical protein B0T16DRAFT_456111 [Cercophora newfieldiana]|uniref:Uncharacterized protein n=1 Tax=Cercophora newfieldiana TaxID=92897 RepID=A0AA40CRK1_9PEZI|nr:hypothetical protein B0T16DRAFT_456111 [Cercophora newfieldiana]